MSQQVFADGIGPIVVVGGTVRLDLITLVPQEGEGGSRPKQVVENRLFMPTDAFVNAARRFAEAAEAITKIEQQLPKTAAAPAAEPLKPIPEPPRQTAEPPRPPAPAAPPPPPERSRPPFP